MLISCHCWSVRLCSLFLVFGLFLVKQSSACERSTRSAKACEVLERNSYYQTIGLLLVPELGGKHVIFSFNDNFTFPVPACFSSICSSQDLASVAWDTRTPGCHTAIMTLDLVFAFILIVLQRNIAGHDSPLPLCPPDLQLTHYLLPQKESESCGLPLSRSYLFSKHNAILVADPVPKNAFMDSLVSMRIYACRPATSHPGVGEFWKDSLSVGDVIPWTLAMCQAAEVNFWARISSNETIESVKVLAERKHKCVIGACSIIRLCVEAFDVDCLSRWDAPQSLRPAAVASGRRLSSPLAQARTRWRWHTTGCGAPAMPP